MNSQRDLIITESGIITNIQLERYDFTYKDVVAQYPILLHHAQNNTDFVQRFYWLLKNNFPQAIIPEKISNVELEKIQHQLGKHCYLKQENIIPYEGALNRLHSQTALVLFTSGSSGVTKAVQLSKDNIHANTEAVIETLDFHQTQNQILYLPLHYTFGLLGQLLPAIKLGVTTYLFNSLLEIKDKLPTLPPAMISGVPQHYQVLLKLFASNKFENIKQVVSAGAYWSPEDRKQVQSIFPNAILYNNYGQTELSPRALCVRSSDPDFFHGVTGRAVPGLQARITSTGELQFKGKQVMLGYIGDTPLDSDYWWQTGDYATEANGLYTVIGRKDDLIKIQGERTSLLAINNLIKSISGVEDAMTLNDSSDPNAAILINFLIPNAQFNLIEFKKELMQKISPHLIPKKIFQLSEFPHLESGKVDRQKLKQDLNLRKTIIL